MLNVNLPIFCAHFFTKLSTLNCTPLVPEAQYYIYSDTTKYYAYTAVLNARTACRYSVNSSSPTQATGHQVDISGSLVCARFMITGAVVLDFVSLNVCTTPCHHHNLPLCLYSNREPFSLGSRLATELSVYKELLLIVSNC